MLSRSRLGESDLVVSALCLGTNRLGTALDQAAGDALLDAFHAMGGNFVDTARLYGDWVPDAPPGASERAIGAWLRARGHRDMIVATKGGGRDLRNPSPSSRCTPELIERDLMESREHLGLATIDLYWLHADNPGLPVTELVDALIGFQHAGLIRHFGASNWTPQRIGEAQTYAQSRGHGGFAAVQPFWGLASPNRDAAKAQGYQLHYEEGFGSVHAQGLPMVPYAGQSRGWFTKAAQGDEAMPANLHAMYDNAINRARLQHVCSIAAAHGATINEIVLAYLLRQPLQTVPIIGAGSPEQLEESAKAAAIHLSAAELDLLAS